MGGGGGGGGGDILNDETGTFGKGDCTPPSGYNFLGGTWGGGLRVSRVINF